MFLNCKILKEHNLYFDDRFFMYFEDFDLMRRIHKVSKTIFYPHVSIIHDHAKESYKSKKMLIQHIKSAIKYFNKWDWIFDKERKEMNDTARKMAEIVWTMLSDKQDFDSSKMMGKYKPMNLVDQALAVINQ